VKWYSGQKKGNLGESLVEYTILCRCGDNCWPFGRDGLDISDDWVNLCEYPSLRYSDCVTVCFYLYLMRINSIENRQLEAGSRIKVGGFF